MAGRGMTYAVFALTLLCASLGEETECPSLENTHAVTGVLRAMNKLLTILAKEVRELRSQVVKSCTAKNSGTLGCATEAGLAERPGGDEKPLLNMEHRLPDGEDKAAEGDTAADGKGDTAEGETAAATTTAQPVTVEATTIATTTTTSKSLPPVQKPLLNTEHRLPDGGDEAAEGDTAADGKGDTAEGETAAATTTAQPVTVEATTIATTTTTSESLPPVPTWCPPSFTLEADGCYIFIYDERNWRTWGDAHAFCQTYGGELASPYRLAPLQAYLDAHFSETFWVGARLRNRRKFFWFNKRRVDEKAWKEGQPSIHPNMKCVYLDKRSGYRATNFFCGEKHPFVCDYRET
ncbi:uncharacterized protein LOC134768606 [Penaeus indicus]|uniref:uncharacterized protein LOC134768606 n=1 Tax=Penaeus indicus TaxID=29960 RepID=UPI00300C37D3